MYRTVLLRILLTLGLWLLALTCARAAEPVIQIVISERSSSYLETADALCNELERSGMPRSEMQVVSIGELPGGAAVPSRLVVTVGSQALAAMAAGDQRPAMLATLLPRVAFEQILHTTTRKPSPSFSAIYLNQPFGRQLDLIRLALPEAHRVGVLWGGQAYGQIGAMQAAAQERNIQLVSARIGAGETVFPALQRVLDDSDVLLSVPDPQIYNSASIQNILLTSFRKRVPFAGFSPAYVAAGALFSVHSTPAMIGRQAATLARNFLQGRGLPATAVYPADFTVTVNEQVARSLGLSLSAAALQDRLRQMERTP